MKESTKTSSNAPSKGRVIAYWLTTGLVAANLGVGSVVDIIQIPYIRRMGLHLGYPDYMSINLAIWELFGTIALLSPGFLRLKEWAYAGAFFLFTGAIFSRLAVGDGAGELVPPIVFTSLTVASWYFRPSSRRFVPNQKA
jgi:hypothetical protein